jgi:hypothetical protein
MAIGSSGRIVIDVDPTEKSAIYHGLKAQGLTMREWFLAQAKSVGLLPTAGQEHSGPSADIGVSGEEIDNAPYCQRCMPITR